jgi:AraC family transcriptional regulator of adaptative response / DNA-3-methyladenine glycosylase II
LEEAIAALRRLPGVGEWTAKYIAMREPDAFPAADIGLMRPA